MVMNHKTKYCNCLEPMMINQDSLMILLRHIFVKFGLQSLYIITCRCYCHTLSRIQIVCVGFEFLLFAQIYFTKDMKQENVNFLTSSLFKNNVHSCHFLSLFFPYFLLVCVCVCVINNGKLGATPFSSGLFFFVYQSFDYFGQMCGLFFFGCKIMLILLQHFISRNLI